MNAYYSVPVLPNYYEGIMSSNPISANKHDSVGSPGIIVSKFAANLRSIPTKQAQSLTNRLDRQQLIAIAAYFI